MTTLAKMLVLWAVCTSQAARGERDPCMKSWAAFPQSASDQHKATLHKPRPATCFLESPHSLYLPLFCCTTTRHRHGCGSSETGVKGGSLLRPNPMTRELPMKRNPQRQPRRPQNLQRSPSLQQRQTSASRPLAYKSRAWMKLPPNPSRRRQLPKPPLSPLFRPSRSPLRTTMTMMRKIAFLRHRFPLSTPPSAHLALLPSELHQS